MHAASRAVANQLIQHTDMRAIKTCRDAQPVQRCLALAGMTHTIGSSGKVFRPPDTSCCQSTLIGITIAANFTPIFPRVKVFHGLARL